MTSGPASSSRCSTCIARAIAASHGYFVQGRRVISIPDRTQAVRDAVDRVYEDFFATAESAAEIATYRKKFPKVKAALETHADAEVWVEIERRQSKSTAATARDWRDYKAEEIETFRRPAHGERTPPADDFSAEVLPKSAIPKKFRPYFERIVLVSRLREVVAQYGFTRFDTGSSDVVPSAQDLGVQHALLSREPSWCPAVENRGEGFFIGFRDDAFAAWRERAKAQVDKRAARFEAAFDLWREQRKIPPRYEFPGLELVLLHSFSHMLLTAVALECGYSADRYEGADRACLHAKCIVVDGAKAFVTSANFSGAAHERNVELGVCIDDPRIAAAIEEELDELITAGVLAPLRL